MRSQPPVRMAAGILGFMAVLLSHDLEAVAPQPVVNLRESVRPSPLRFVSDGDLTITGSSSVAEGQGILVKVGTSKGTTFETKAPVKAGRFSCRFPADFSGAPALSPCLLYFSARGGEGALLESQAEASLIIADLKNSTWPDLPAAFTDDLLDAKGASDTAASSWESHRALVNLFVTSRGAKLAGIGREKFDLASPKDLQHFKTVLSVYDFDHRDRDWSAPLNNRPARTFWRAEWKRWFGPGNDHPWDGNAANREQENYRPYTFANDLADLLVMHQMRRALPRTMSDNRDAMCDEALGNLLALQHRDATSFALEDNGRKEQYTAGAFRYGLFETGEWMTEGTGWFVNPDAGDHRKGGVFNGRSVWALGESLKTDPQGPKAAATREAIALALRFCLHDGLASKYTRLLKPHLPLWKHAGEHGYLTLGMLAASQVAPELPIVLDPAQPAKPLHEVTANALNALVAQLPRGTSQWTKYPDQDAMAVAALAEGAETMPVHPDAQSWRATAMLVADGWISARPESDEQASGLPNFGQRHGSVMDFLGAQDTEVRVNLYISGLWLHALANLYTVTGELRYRERAEALLAYLCGNNPFHARLLNELGSVYNIIHDTGDAESTMRWDAYPESTAFVQIGLMRWFAALKSHPTPLSLK